MAVIENGVLKRVEDIDIVNGTFEIPEGVTEIGMGAFWECSSLTSIELPEGVTEIGMGAFQGCSSLTRIEIPEGVTKIGDKTFCECESLISIKIPEGVTEIGAGAFHGCSSLTRIEIPEGVTEIGVAAFWCYSNLKEISKIIDADKVMINLENILNFVSILNFGWILCNNYNFKQCADLSKKLDKHKLKIVGRFIEILEDKNMLQWFVQDADFKSFKSHIPNINELLEGKEEEEYLDFYKFATVLGCFSTEKVLDRNGQETQTTISQKASALLAQLLKTEQMQIGKYHGLFDSLPIDAKVSQEFLSFISPTGKGKNMKFENLNLLMELEQKYPGIFVKVMADFDKVKQYRVALDESGRPITISWSEAIEKYNLDNVYTGVREENSDIAQLYGSIGISQEVFDEASRLRDIAHERNVPEHILGTPLKEESILETIEHIKEQTQELIDSSKDLIDDLYAKQFTYEWLSKNDPRNAIMGRYCSCCGTITSQAYGKNIAKSSVIAPDIQNIVVRNNQGEIISKGTMYVNQESGYAVINDFELNVQYRKHEEGVGRYDVPEDSNEEKQRQLIFEAFLRGIEAFVEQYDKQHPDKPIKQINVGMGYNRLKKQLERFEKATSNLTVPAEYSFQDASNEQRILYRRGQKVLYKKEQGEISGEEQEPIEER